MKKSLTSAMYVNVHSRSNGGITMSQPYHSRGEADQAWNTDHPCGHISPYTGAERIACIRVPVVCVEGQFDD